MFNPAVLPNHPAQTIKDFNQNVSELQDSNPGNSVSLSSRGYPGTDNSVQNVSQTEQRYTSGLGLFT